MLVSLWEADIGSEKIGRGRKTANGGRMARADLLLALVQSGAGGDDLAFRRAAEALIAEEENKKHNVLASQLADALTRRRAAARTSPR